MTCKRHVMIAPNDEKLRGRGLAYTTVLIFIRYPSVMLISLLTLICFLCYYSNSSSPGLKNCDLCRAVSRGRSSSRMNGTT